MAVLLFGLRAGLAAAALSSRSLLALGCLGQAAAGMAIPALSKLAGWVVVALNFSLENIVLTLAVGAVMDALDSARATAVANGTALDRERQLLSTLVDALPDVVFTKDMEERFTVCNPATLALFGVRHQKDVAGKTVFDLFRLSSSSRTTTTTAPCCRVGRC